jgi:hypothetical protein
VPWQLQVTDLIAAGERMVERQRFSFILWRIHWFIPS